ncbi:MAG: tRNA pseudouridine(13) synthase TruD [Candidatus Omnitrophica bacterium]|nr:tRNA pseudouridine(13) synthase TruD [Candidatus Omnitrophota bacterium]
MKIKIKSVPEDFVVVESAELPLKSRGRFGIYLLKKKGWNTVGLLLELSRKLKIPYKNFAYGGKKDRHALTSQYVSIKGAGIKEIGEMDYSLELLGFLERPMAPDLIRGNKFSITVRNLRETEAQGAVEEIETVKAYGYPNYFDDQRFGGQNALGGFLAEKIIKGHFNGALKIYLCGQARMDAREGRKRKEFFSRNWGDWSKCNEKANTGYEKKVFDFLARHPKRFLPLLKQIPREILSVYFNAYQAFVWNEVLRRAVKNTVSEKLRSYRGSCGDYLFYDRAQVDRLKGLEIPTLAGKMDLKDALSAKLYTEVLEENGIKRAMFNKMKLRSPYFKSVLRKAIVFPKKLTFKVSPDELNRDRKKLSLSFTLGRGSYATMLVKRIFSK